MKSASATLFLATTAAGARRRSLVGQLGGGLGDLAFQPRDSLPRRRFGGDVDLDVQRQPGLADHRHRRGLRVAGEGGFVVDAHFVQLGQRLQNGAPLA